MVERNPLESLIKHLSSITPYPEIKELIQEIKKTFIIIVGEEDALVGTTNIRNLLKEFGKLDDLFIVQGAGHLVIEEANHYVADKIRKFI